MWLYHVVKIKSLITLFRTLFLEMLKPKSKHFCFKEVSKSVMLGKVFWKEILRQVYKFKSEMVRLDIHTIIDKSKYIVHVTMFDRFKKTIFKFFIQVNNAKATVGFVYLQTADKNAMREYIALHYWKSKRWTEKHIYFYFTTFKKLCCNMQGSHTSLSTLSSVNWCTTGARLAWLEKCTQFLINKYGKPLFFIEYFC